MKRLLVVFAVALAVPAAAAAQAKELTGFSLCGPDECHDGDMTGFGHNGPFGGAVGDGEAPPPSDFLRLELAVDGHEAAWVVFYEPVTGLVKTESSTGRPEWRRPAPALATAMKDAAKGLETFPAPRVTGVRIGRKTVEGDPSSYLRLISVDGPFAFPKTYDDAEQIVFQTPDPNPWTDVNLLYYAEDDVLARYGTYVKLPADLAADLEAGRPLGGDGGTNLSWAPIGVALAGLLALVAWRARGGARKLLPARPPTPTV